MVIIRPTPDRRPLVGARLSPGLIQTPESIESPLAGRAAQTFVAHIARPTGADNHEGVAHHAIAADRHGLGVDHELRIPNRANPERKEISLLRIRRQNDFDLCPRFSIVFVVEIRVG